jgi:hypothetical protein
MAEPKPPRTLNSRVRAPDGGAFELHGIPSNGRAVLCALFVAMLNYSAKKRKLELDDRKLGLDDWREALRAAHGIVIKMLAKIGPNDEPASANAERDRIEQQLDEIAACPPDEQARRLDALYHNVVLHQGQQLATLPASSVGTPNWEVASKLSLASSEKLAIQMGEAYERGGFEPVGSSPYPTAAIYARDDPEHFVREVLLYAELVANQRLNAEPSTLEQKQLKELAERLGDPKSAAGPRTAQVLCEVLAAWLRSRRDDNSVTLTIYQLAEVLRYKPHQRGGYRARDLDEIRDCWATISMTRLTSPDGRLQGPLMAVNDWGAEGMDHDDILAQELLTPADLIKKSAAARWTHIRVTPHQLFIRLAGANRAQVMGRDNDLNKLHPVKERADLLLGKSLEVDFRINWHRGRGRLVRRVEELLRAAGLPTDKPRIATLRRLEDALEKLDDAGTLREWRDLDGRFDEMMGTAAVADTLGRLARMTENRWRSALESRMELEAGAAYVKHYRNFGLTKEPKDGGALIGEIQQHLVRTGSSQAVLAENLGITRQYLSSILNGKRRISEALEQRINDLLKQASTLQLPLGEPP